MRGSKKFLSSRRLIWFLAATNLISFFLLGHQFSSNQKLRASLEAMKTSQAQRLDSELVERQAYVVVGEIVGNWNTFRDDYYGYYINFPPKEWRILPQKKHLTERPNQTVDFVAPDGERVEITVWENTENFSLSEWFLRHQTPSLPEGFDIPDEPNAQIGKRKAFFTVEPYSPMASEAVVTAVIKNKNLMFRIEYHASSKASGKDIYLHMLNTFGFVGEQQEILDDDIPPIAL